jgi:isopentenyl phosphate kinase
MIVKLGGSVITHKRESPPKIHEKNLYRIADELKVGPNPKVVVLGGGAHGHQAAHTYGFGDPKTPASRLLEGIPVIRHNMSVLALRTEEELNKRGLKAVIIPPFIQTIMKNGLVHEFPVDAIRRCLGAGLSVITHGDVCLEQGGSASILSGDVIVAHLAQSLDADKVLIGTDVDGIYDDNPNTTEAARLVPVVNKSNVDKIMQKTGPSSSTDVTGGMSRKVSELVGIAETSAEVIVFNLSIPGRLSSLLLDNEVVCTRIRMG